MNVSIIHIYIYILCICHTFHISLYMIVYRGCYAYCAATLDDDSPPSLSDYGMTLLYFVFNYQNNFFIIINALQHMLGAQTEAQSYHHTRFGDMPTPNFAITPPAEPEPVYFIRPRTRTEW